LQKLQCSIYFWIWWPL